MSNHPNKDFVGHIAEDSPLRGIFPDGRCPLMGPLTRPAILGDAQEKADVYMLSLRACSETELEAIATMLAKNGNDTIEGARKFVAEANEMPIRAKNLTGCSFPMRYIT